MRLPLARVVANAALARASDWYGWRELPTYGRTAWVVTAGTLLLGIGRGIVAPFLVLYLVTAQHIPLAIVGLGIMLEFVIRALVGPVAGTLSDRMGRKPLMLMGLLGTTLLLPSYLLVTTASAFVAISVANGLFAGPSLYGPASTALVADVVAPNRRGAVFGLIHASRNLGWTLGIALGALLIGAGYWPIFVAGGLVPLAFFFVTLAFVKEPRQHADVKRPSAFASWRALFSSKLFVAYLLLTIVFYLGWGQVNSIFALYLTEGLGLSTRAVALIAINSALIFFLQVPFGRLADRSSRTTLLAFAALALAAAYVAYEWAPLAGGGALAILALVVGIVIFTLAEMLYSPVLNALAADLAAAGTTGSAIGVLTFAAAIGQGAPPVLADRIVPAFGWGALWALLAALTVASAFGLRWLGRRIPTSADQPGAVADGQDASAVASRPTSP